MIFKLAWRNITTRPLSSGLSIILLSSSIMVIVLSILTMKQMDSKFKENANKIDLVVGAKGSRLQSVLCNVFHIDYPNGNIQLKDVNFLSKHPFVKNAVPISLGDSYKKHRIIGTNPSFIKQIYNASISKGNIFSKPLEVVIGANVAAKLKLVIGDSFNGSHGIEESIHDHDDFLYHIVGVLNPTGDIIDQLIVTSLESVWQVHPHDYKKGSFDLKTAEEHEHHSHDHESESYKDNKEITAVLVNYSSPRAKFSIPGIVNQINSLMGAEPAIEIKQLLDLIEPAVNILYLLSLFIFGLSLFSIVVTLLNSMKDRKYEISMMRVGGASVRLIFISIVLEGFFIGLIGSVSGLLLGHSIMGIMARFLNFKYNYQFSGLVFDKLELVLLLLTILIGMIAAIFPAITAYRLDISKTLKNKI